MKNDKSNSMRIKIVKFVNNILENLKDDALQNRKIFKIIKNHILILSFLIILMGFSFLFYSNYESTTRNIIYLSPSNDFSGIYSKIYIEYKEPVMRGDLIKVNKVCTDIIWSNISVKDSLNYSINKIWINLYGSKDSNIYDETFRINVISNQYMEDAYKGYSYTLGRNCMRPTGEWGDSIYIPEYIKAEKENSNSEYTFNYDIYTSEESSNFSIETIWEEKASLMFPIPGANPTEERNIRINRMVLFFTGLLIIFASLPFCYSLKELLQK